MTCPDGDLHQLVYWARTDIGVNLDPKERRWPKARLSLWLTKRGAAASST
jgi:hypothetical protein